MLPLSTRSKVFTILVVLATDLCASGADDSAAPALILPVIKAQLGSARVRTKNDLLEVTTGRVTRRWNWTAAGLVTVSFRDELSGKEWAKPQPARACDWDLPGAIGNEARGELVSLTANTNNDEGFTSQHLQVISTVRYPQAKLELQHIIWVYPNATGIRTQLRVRALEGFSPKGLPAKEGVRIENPSDSDPLVILKHFGPGNPDAESLRKKK